MFNIQNIYNPDDSRDNVDKIQYNISKTIQNIESAEEMIGKIDDEKTKIHPSQWLARLVSHIQNEGEHFVLNKDIIRAR